MGEDIKLTRFLNIMEKKPVKILCLVNTLTSVSSFVYHNHIELFSHSIRKNPETQIAFFSPHRMSIDTARNTAAEYAMSLECDYLMFLDDDVMVPKDSIQRLVENDKDICAGLVIIRGMPFNVMAFRFGKRSKQQRNLGFFNDLPKKKDGTLQKLVSCDAVGFSLCLIKVELLKKLRQPYFLTGTGATEDVYFCINAKDQIKETSIYMDTSLQCGHLLNPEPVGWLNRDRLRTYYDSLLELKPKEEGRGKDYFSKNISLLK